MFRIAIIINPLAGLGGKAGLKGSDHAGTAAKAKSLGISEYARERVSTLMVSICDMKGPIHIFTPSGPMGVLEHKDALAKAGHNLSSIYDSPERTSSEDTFNAAKEARKYHLDLLLFAGGDGTARDIYRAVGDSTPVLGIPSGVKMHSGVFAVTPKAAASVIASMMAGRLVAALPADVRDIDEEAFVKGFVKTRYFGEMLVPDDQLLVQSVKCSGLPDDEFVLQEIAAFVAEQIEGETLYILGSGGTLKTIKQELDVEEPTLLGVDVWKDGEVVAVDVNEPRLFELVSQHEHIKLLLSVIGGQGIVLGRGNQQLSPRVIEAVGLDNIQLVGTPSKIQALEGKPLRVDTGSETLDQAFKGAHSILSGYDQYILYHIE